MRQARLALLLWLAVVGFAVPAGSEPLLTLVLPLRSTGVDETTVNAVGDLLRAELENRGIALVPSSQLKDLPRGDSACDDVECANAAAAATGAGRIVYGTLTRLGNKIIFHVRAVWIGETMPDYADQVTAATEEDLDVVCRRVAESIAAGRPDARHATIGTVTQEETLEPRRRATRSGLGLRAGFLFPANGSYGNADRLTSLGLVIRYETPTFFVQSTPLVGFAWRGDTVEWTPFDLFLARIFGVGDFSPYVGAGLGISALHVQKNLTVAFGDYLYPSSTSQSSTSLAADLDVGLLMLRTYDFAIVLDVRYHYVFEDFDAIGGNGAHGLALRFGIGR
jgi:hypothetical protein